MDFFLRLCPAPRRGRGGQLNYLKGMVEDAEMLLQRALKIQLSVSGPNSPEVAQTKHNLYPL
jgi:hypothetical protein